MLLNVSVQYYTGQVKYYLRVVSSPLSGRGEGMRVCVGGGGEGDGWGREGRGMLRMGQDTHMAVYCLLRILLPV